MILLDGKTVSEQIYSNLATQIASLDSHLPIPCLAAVLIGNNPASETYIANKIKSCEKVGMQSLLIRLPDTVSEKELLESISALNADAMVNGIIAQLPLPKHLVGSELKIIEQINPLKDVDGFSPINIGKMTLGLDALIPATPGGIMDLLEYYDIATQGKHAVVLGRSHIVGTPMSILLSQNVKYGNCTVTICHSRTKNVAQISQTADILIAAIGKPKMVTSEWVKEGAIVIDVGIHRIESTETKSGFKLVGDVDFQALSAKCSYITPVPGGVGLVTVARLIKNTFISYQRQHSLN